MDELGSEWKPASDLRGSAALDFRKAPVFLGDRTSLGGPKESSANGESGGESPSTAGPVRVSRARHGVSGSYRGLMSQRQSNVISVLLPSLLRSTAPLRRTLASNPSKIPVADKTPFSPGFGTAIVL